MSDYDTTSYDTTSYDTTSYDTTSYDTTSYDTTAYDTGSYTESTGYDVSATTDWSAVADDAADWTASSYDWMHTGSDLWDASVDAYLAGDNELAYELNQQSIAAYSVSDDAWDTSNSLWSDAASDPTYTTWEATPTYDASSYDTAGYATTSSYDAGYATTSSYDSGSSDSSDW